MQTLIHGNEETDIYAMLFSRSSFLSFFFFLLLFFFSTKKRIVPSLSFLIVLTSSTVSARWAVKQTPISPLLTKSIRCSFPASFPPPSSPANANARWQNWLLGMKLFCGSNRPPPRGWRYSCRETFLDTWNFPSLVIFRYIVIIN